MSGENGVVADDEIAETHKRASDAYVVVIYGDNREVHVSVDSRLSLLREQDIRPIADAKRITLITQQENALIGDRKVQR